MAHDADAQKFARIFLKHVLGLQSAIREARSSIADDRQTGGPRDATAMAGALAAELRRVGAQLPHDRNPHTLRWYIDEGVFTALADADGTAGATNLAAYVLAAIKKGPGPDPVLDRVANVWPKCRTKGEADKAVGEIEQAEEQARQHAAREAHEKRLGEAHAARTRRPNSFPVAETSPATIMQNKSDELPEGESLVGDPYDFSGKRGGKPLTVG